MSRLSWDEYFYSIAELVASRGTCIRRQVGALIVLDKRILATGYTGSPPGQSHCTEIGCLMEGDRCIRTVHAEQNAIIQCSLHGVSCKGGTLYSTYRPCMTCAKQIITAGIVRVVCPGDRVDQAWYYLKGSGIIMTPVEEILSKASPL